MRIRIRNTGKMYEEIPSMRVLCTNSEMRTRVCVEIYRVHVLVWEGGECISCDYVSNDSDRLHFAQLCEQNKWEGLTL